MKNPLLVVSLVLLFCFVFGCQKKAEEAAEKAAAEMAALSVKDVAAIKTLHDAYVQAVLAGGLKATAEFYAEDAILIAKGPIIQGREAFKKSLESLSKASPTITAFNLTLAEIDGRNDLAFVRGTASMSMASEGAPEPIQYAGKFLEILRKQKDGSWLIAREIRASD
jgi:uncharacterized protein (TIGR02246 family)